MSARSKDDDGQNGSGPTGSAAARAELSRRRFLRRTTSAAFAIGAVGCSTAPESAVGGSAADADDATADASFDASIELDTSAPSEPLDVVAMAPDDVAARVQDAASLEDVASLEDAATMPEDATATVDDAISSPDDVTSTADAGSAVDGKIVTFDVDQWKVSEKRFPLGVQAGAMRLDSAVLWCLDEGKGAPTLKVWREHPQLQDMVVMAHDAPVKPGDGGYCKAPVSGLLPATWYDYAWFGGPDRSVVGQFQTAPAAGDKSPLTIAATTCTSLSMSKEFKALSKMAKEPIDLMVHLGDMSYNDGAKTLSQYRGKWRKTLSAQGYRDLLSTAGYYITWDDHEVDNNFNPETMNKAHLKAAKDAFFETTSAERGPKDRLWRSYMWGATAEIFVLDSRSERKPSTAKSDKPIYIGLEQMAWLKAGLKSSKAHFKVLLNSVPITEMPIWYLSKSDRWQGYEKQRDELLGHIADTGINNVWFLSGDFHLSFVARVGNKGAGKDLYEIAVGPGANLNPLGIPALFPASQFLHMSATIEVATTLTFDPATNEVHVRYIQASNGKVLYDKKLKQA